MRNGSVILGEKEGGKYYKGQKQSKRVIGILISRQVDRQIDKQLER